ncbi:MAG: prenyltransferase [Deltaproteobacteria bacterium]|nr:prenyltransferase [Deltaproteobacteria bacterium]
MSAHGQPLPAPPDLHETPLRVPPWLVGVYRLADPKITLASAASLFLGAAGAAHEGPLSWPWLLVTLFGIFCLEAAKNASGEIYDFDSGADQAVEEADRSPFSGGKRVLVDGLLSRGQAATVAAVFYAAGILSGAGIVLFREPRVFWVGLLGVLLAFFYHAPPLRLAYRGLGELAVALCYGPLIALGTFLVQRHALSSFVLYASLPLGLLIAGFLWVNEFPDYRADASAGKRTLVVRLGRRAASRVFAVLVALSFAAVIALPFLGLPPTVWLGLLGLPHGVAAARRVLRWPEETPKLVPAQAHTLVSFLLLSVGLGFGLLLVRLAR